MAANNTSEASTQWQKANSLAARLAEAAAQPTLPEPALAGFIARHWSNAPSPSRRSCLPSGLEPADAAALASALAAALDEYPYPLTTATFRPENILTKPALTGWQITLKPPGAAKPNPGPDLTEKARLLAFTGLLYRLAVGQALAEDRESQKAQLAQLHNHHPYLAVILKEALAGGFASAVALAGGFGWSLYRTTHLNFAPVTVTKKRNFLRWLDRQKVVQPAQQLPTQTVEIPANNRTLGGPLAQVSLAVALVLVVGTIAFSLSGLDSDYRQPSSALSRPPLQTAIPSPSPAVALQISRQSDGASLTRYDPAFDQTAGEQYTDPAQLVTGNVAVLSDFRSLQIQSARWSADDTRLDLALTDGGWETWDIAAKQRLSRQELPNTEQYQAVSWSPDGQNFVAAGLDGELRLGKAGQVVRTVRPNGSGTDSGGRSTYPGFYSWSPDSAFVLMWVGNNLQLWNFHNIPAQIELPQNSAGPVISMSGNIPAGSIVWSPDSRYLARLIPGSLNQPQQVEIYNPNNLARRYMIEVPDTPTGGNNLQTGQYIGTPGLAWSPDGRYMAILRAFQLHETGTTNNSSEGTVVSILELPELSNSADPGQGNQSRPTTQDTPNSPATPPGNSPIAANSPSLKPIHLETLVLTGLTDQYYANGSNLAWSNNNRLLVMGNKSPPDSTGQQPAYQALILDLQAGSDRWRWQPGSQFDLPVQYRPAYVGWLPDNRQILFNSDNLLAYFLPPDQAGKAVTTQVLYIGNTNTNQALAYLPSPDGRSFLFTQYKDNGYALSIRDTASGQTQAELAAPPGLFSNPGKGLWSADSRVLVIPFTVRTITTGGAEQVEEIVRAWRIEPDRTPVVIGDLIIPTPDDNYNYHFNNSNNFSWDDTENSPALLFKFQSGQIGRWDLTKPLPSLDEQRRVVAKNATQIAPPPSAWSYFQVIGKIYGTTQTNTNSKWAWFPEHKQLIFCSANSCFIQQMLAPEATYNLDTDRGTGFEPQPFSIESNLAVSPDGRMAAVGLHSGLLNLYAAHTGKLFNSFPANLGAFSSMSFSPDGHYLVASGDKVVKVWDATSWRLLAMLRLVSPNANSLNAQWLPDNKTLAVGGNYSGALLLWRALP